MDPTFDDLIPGHPAYSQVSFDDLIPGHRAYAPPGGGVSFDDLIPTQGAPWQPSRGSAGAVDFGQTLGNVSVGPGAQRSQSDYAAASAPYGQSMLTSVSPRTLAQYEGAAGLDLNVGQDPGVPDHVSGASLPSPGASARHLQAAAASSPFPIPLRSLSGDAEAADARGPQLSPAVRAYLLAPGTPVSASGAPTPVRLVSPGPGNVTIDTYPEKNTTIPEIPAPLLAPGASVRSQADDYTRLSYLVSSKGSSENYSPLTFLPGALGIATAKPGDTWAGVKLTSDDIAAAQRFTEWAQRSRLENSPDLGGAWNGYRFVQEGGINPAQQRFAALKAALDQQYWWMAVPALAPLAVAGAPTIASALDTGGGVARESVR